MKRLMNIRIEENLISQFNMSCLINKTTMTKVIEEAIYDYCIKNKSLLNDFVVNNKINENKEE